MWYDQTRQPICVIYRHAIYKSFYNKDSDKRTPAGHIYYVGKLITQKMLSFNTKCATFQRYIFTMQN